MKNSFVRNSFVVSPKGAKSSASCPADVLPDGYRRGYILKKGAAARQTVAYGYGTNGGIKTAYTYTPFGQVTASGSVTQPIQWSSEYADTDLALVYYNYRHYNPQDGRWNSEDLITRKEGLNLYAYVGNLAFSADILGLENYCQTVLLGVAFGGDSFYEAGQNEACEWLPCY